VKALQTAIFARYTTDTTIMALTPSGLYLSGDVPHEKALPYTTYGFLPALNVGSMGSSVGYDYLEVIVDFTIWVASGQLDTGYSIRERLLYLFNRWHGSFTGGGRIVGSYIMKPGLPMKELDTETYRLDMSWRIRYTER